MIRHTGNIARVGGWSLDLAVLPLAPYPLLLLVLSSIRVAGAGTIEGVRRMSPLSRTRLLAILAVLLAALGVGIAGGSFAVGIAYVSKFYPTSEQGTALGIFGAGNVGAAVTKFVAPFVLLAFGWEAVAQYWAAGLAVIALVFFVFTTDDPDLVERRRRGVRPRSMLEQFAPLKNVQVWRFALYYFFVFGAFVALALWLPRYLVGVYGLDLKTAGMVAAAFSVPASLFRIYGGHLSDKVGARQVMYWTFLVGIAATFLLSYPPTSYVIDGIDGPISFRLETSLVGFTIIIFVLGFFMSLGKAAVFKHIPVYYPNDVGAVGGLENLKQWLTERRKLFQMRDDISEEIVPKGVLMMGIPGCGKSLSVKAIASHFQLPLYRLDMIEIFSGRHGKPEGVFVQACRMMEDMAPAVLWFDEIEMGVTSTEAGGEQGRIFAFFLTWMQEKTRGLFVAATANRIDLLPAEMIRKGRFDEVFFVDIPLADEQLEIFKIHLKRRGVEPGRFDFREVLQFTVGWTGAEIEQCVVSAVTRARLEDREITEEDLIGIAAKLVPLSRTMKEQINHIRSWAFERALRASPREGDR